MSKETKQIGIRLPIDLAERMEKVTKEMSTMPSAYIRDAILLKVMEDEKKLAEHKKATE